MEETFGMAQMAAETWAMPELVLSDRFGRQVDRGQRIRELAYFKWQDAGCPFEQDLDFWLKAEDEYVAAERLVNGY